MAIGLMIYEVDLVLSRRFLSQAGEGANSWFYYAQRLCDFPQGIFSLAIATATLPSLAALAAKNDRAELAQTAAHAIRLALFVSLPATALLVALARPIVTVVFARGAFDLTSVDGTTAALVVQALGIVVVALVRQLVPIFHALGDTRTPVLISGLDLLAFIAIALAARGPWGHVGISAAVTGSSFVQAALLLFALRRRVPELRPRMFGKSAAVGTISAIVAAAFAVATERASAAVLPKALALGCGTAAFAVTFFALGRLLRSDEQAEIRGALRRRLRRR
jgi:putative peptidoglycan lipid II flippase